MVKIESKEIGLALARALQLNALNLVWGWMTELRTKDKLLDDRDYVLVFRAFWQEQSTTLTTAEFTSEVTDQPRGSLTDQQVVELGMILEDSTETNFSEKLLQAIRQLAQKAETSPQVMLRTIDHFILSSIKLMQESDFFAKQVKEKFRQLQLDPQLLLQLYRVFASDDETELNMLSGMISDYVFQTIDLASKHGSWYSKRIEQLFVALKPMLETLDITALHQFLNSPEGLQPNQPSYHADTIVMIIVDEFKTCIDEVTEQVVNDTLSNIVVELTRLAKENAGDLSQAMLDMVFQTSLTSHNLTVSDRLFLIETILQETDNSRSHFEQLCHQLMALDPDTATTEIPGQRIELSLRQRALVDTREMVKFHQNLLTHLTDVIEQSKQLELLVFSPEQMNQAVTAVLNNILKLLESDLPLESILSDDRVQALVSDLYPTVEQQEAVAQVTTDIIKSLERTINAFNSASGAGVSQGDHNALLVARMSYRTYHTRQAVKMALLEALATYSND